MKWFHRREKSEDDYYSDLIGVEKQVFEMVKEFNTKMKEIIDIIQQMRIDAEKKHPKETTMD